MIEIDLGTLSGRETYALMTRCIVPRPIAFVGTRSEAGVSNCAPFSYFMGVSTKPPILAISVGTKRDRSPKDTARNARETGELTVNVVDEALIRACVDAAEELPADVSEFETVGLTPLASTRIRAPRIREAPIQMECRVERVLEVGTVPQFLILAEILCVHAREDVVTEGSIDPRALRPVARLGGTWYAELGRLFEMERPPLDRRREP